jgi:Integrase core domain
LERHWFELNGERISRLPDVDGDKPARAKFKRYPIGYFHIDIAEVHTGEGRLYLLVAIDRTSKSAFVELHEKATRRVAGNFLRALVAAVPYKIHTVLTDNGTHFTDPKGGAWTPEKIKALQTPISALKQLGQREKSGIGRDTVERSCGVNWHADPQA